MTKEPGLEEIVSFLEAQVKQARTELKEEYLPQLGHSQKERLLLAIADYPQNEADFSGEPLPMIRAFSALKQCIDAQVSLGVEIVHQTLQHQTLEKLKEAGVEVPAEVLPKEDGNGE